MGGGHYRHTVIRSTCNRNIRISCHAHAEPLTQRINHTGTHSLPPPGASLLDPRRPPCDVVCIITHMADAGATHAARQLSAPTDPPTRPSLQIPSPRQPTHEHYMR
mmetsp:Transcript_37071/g.93019  ORF Transcript_37071/g.93019 Transcript_37071/m.93019 type:complete len:106 (+) Transcript_37071:98-415(+)